MRLDYVRLTKAGTKKRLAALLIKEVIMFPNESEGESDDFLVIKRRKIFFIIFIILHYNIVPIVISIFIDFYFF